MIVPSMRTPNVDVMKLQHPHGKAVLGVVCCELHASGPVLAPQGDDKCHDGLARR